MPCSFTRVLPAAVAALALTLSVSAGPLTPPGAPSSTGKTLTEVEPRIPIDATTAPGTTTALHRISQSGSYYLTGNLTGVAGKAGIEILAHNVSIDLNGYTLEGVAGSLEGIRNAGALGDNTTIRNGVVTGWGDDGVNLAASGNSDGNRIEAIHVAGNGGYGVITGISAVVRDCIASTNALGGIVVPNGGVIESCVARDNGGNGISGNYGMVIRNSMSMGSAGNGISVSSSSTITNCVASNSGGDGIRATTGANITNCTSSNSGASGIVTSISSTVADCTISTAGASGISVGSASSVTRCTVAVPALDGIVFPNDCAIIGNKIDAAGFGAGGGAAIHATSADNRIEGNIATDSLRGVDVDAAGNFIARNTCSGNSTNWDVVAGNVCLVIFATDAGAISGNSGGTAPGSTDPNANFTY
jgi:parallel beta-helix repeat protein